MRHTASPGVRHRHERDLKPRGEHAPSPAGTGGRKTAAGCAAGTRSIPAGTGKKTILLNWRCPWLCRSTMRPPWTLSAPRRKRRSLMVRATVDRRLRRPCRRHAPWRFVNCRRAASPYGNSSGQCSTPHPSRSRSRERTSAFGSKGLFFQHSAPRDLTRGRSGKGRSPSHAPCIGRCARTVTICRLPDYGITELRSCRTAGRRR